MADAQETIGDVDVLSALSDQLEFLDRTSKVQAARANAVGASLSSRMDDDIRRLTSGKTPLRPSPDQVQDLRLAAVEAIVEAASAPEEMA